MCLAALSPVKALANGRFLVILLEERSTMQKLVPPPPRLSPDCKVSFHLRGTQACTFTLSDVENRGLIGPNSCSSWLWLQSLPFRHLTGVSRCCPIGLWERNTGCWVPPLTCSNWFYPKGGQEPGTGEPWSHCAGGLAALKRSNGRFISVLLLSVPWHETVILTCTAQP